MHAGDGMIEQERQDCPADVGADHEHFAMGKVDHHQHAVDHRVAECDQAVDGAKCQAEYELLRKY